MLDPIVAKFEHSGLTRADIWALASLEGARGAQANGDDLPFEMWHFKVYYHTIMKISHRKVNIMKSSLIDVYLIKWLTIQGNLHISFPTDPGFIHMNIGLSVIP